jgi:hypothetical protein
LQAAEREEASLRRWQHRNLLAEAGSEQILGHHGMDALEPIHDLRDAEADGDTR